MNIRSILLVLLVIGQFKSYGQNELLGLWEGPTEIVTGELRSVIRSKIYVEGFKDGFYYGTISATIEKSGIKVGPNPFKGAYLLDNGVAYLIYGSQMPRRKKSGMVLGQFRLAYQPGQGSSTLIGGFRANDSIDVGNHPIVNVSLTRQGNSVTVGSVSKENNQALLGSPQNSNAVIPTRSASNDKATQPVITVTKLSAGADILFKNSRSKLTVEEKNLIYELTGFQLAKDGIQFALKDMEEFPFEVEVRILDLNNDGKEEVYIGYGNTATSGNAGASCMAIISESYRGYVKAFDHRGMMPAVISGRGGIGLLIGVPGFTYPVYWVNGSSFSSSTIKSNELGGQKLVELSELEAIYQGGGEVALSDRLEKIKSAAWELKRQQQLRAEAALNKRIAEQKGKVAKFVGKWWEMGYYDHPFTLAKIGAYYTLSGKKQSPYNGAKFTFNAKMDRLEGWFNTSNMKVKMVINYIYESDKLEIRALEGNFGFPGYLMKYK